MPSTTTSPRTPTTNPNARTTERPNGRTLDRTTGRRVERDFSPSPSSAYIFNGRGDPTGEQTQQPACPSDRFATNHALAGPKPSDRVTDANGSRYWISV